MAEVKTQVKPFMVYVDGEEMGRYTTKSNANRAAAKFESEDIEILDERTQDSVNSDEVEDAKLKQQVADAIALEEAMNGELNGTGDGFTDEQRENYHKENGAPSEVIFAAEQILKRGEIGEAGFEAVKRGEITLEEAIAQVEQGEEKPARRASANPARKGEGRKRGKSIWSMGVNRVHVEKASWAARVFGFEPEDDDGNFYAFCAGFAEYVYSGNHDPERLRVDEANTDAYSYGFNEAYRQYRSPEKGTLTKVFWEPRPDKGIKID